MWCPLQWHNFLDSLLAYLDASVEALSELVANWLLCVDVRLLLGVVPLQFSRKSGVHDVVRSDPVNVVDFWLLSPFQVSHVVAFCFLCCQVPTCHLRRFARRRLPSMSGGSTARLSDLDCISRANCV